MMWCMYAVARVVKTMSKVFYHLVGMMWYMHVMTIHRTMVFEHLVRMMQRLDVMATAIAMVCHTWCRLGMCGPP